MTTGRFGKVFPNAPIIGWQFGKTIASAGAVFPGSPWIPTTTVNAYRKLPDAAITGVTLAIIPAAPAVGNTYTTGSTFGAFLFSSVPDFWSIDASDIVIIDLISSSEKPDAAITGA